MSPLVRRRIVAMIVAAASGFVCLAAFDGWRPTTSIFDRVSVYATGFALARALGVFSGAPVRVRTREQRTSVSRRGLWARAYEDSIAALPFLLTPPLLLVSVSVDEKPA